MKRVYLQQVASGFAASAGYSFQSGFEWEADAKTTQLPCLFMSPSVLAGKSGRKEGLLRYKMSFVMACLKPKGTGQEEQWQAMEAAACALYDTFAMSPQVFSASELVCTPTQDKLLNGRPTLSVKVTFTVQAGYVTGQ